MSEGNEARGADGVAMVPELLPARMLNEYSYCPRLFYLEWVQGEFADSGDTVEGRWAHRAVDRDGGAPAPMPGDDAPRVRSLRLESERLGLVAVIDAVEAAGRVAVPVDYKRGAVPDGGVFEPERVQLCVQALLLREHGYTCDEGMLWFAESRRRVAVAIDDDLVHRTLELLGAAREIAASGVIPPPLVDSPKCPRCSLVGICLPDETNELAHRAPPAARPRRLIPARDDARPLHVVEQGAKVGKSGGRLVIEIPERGPDQKKTKVERRLIDVSELCLHGNVQVSAQAVRQLARESVAICHFSYGGWFDAVTTGMAHKNVEQRIAQYRAAGDETARLRIARRIVDAKIRNQRTLIRRNHAAAPPATLTELTRLAGAACRARAVETLLGVEGAAAKAYFAAFSGMVKNDVAGDFDFTARSRRPPRDPINALLSFVYALLVRDIHVRVLTIGLDPLLGFYHRPRYGRPALALDLAEEFRPIVADSVVVNVINNGEVRASDFVVRGAAAALTDRGRRQVIAAYERRVETEVRHPRLGYSVSYRRVFEVQARLLVRHLLGEIPAYVPFRTR